jgi:hypothetical protein
MAYTTTTLSAALAEMGSRLYDPAHIRWTTPELTIYIQQAIRTFSALTNHFRDQATFATTNKQAFYDLGTVVPTLRAQTYTVQAALTQLAYMLLEPPPVGNVWSGTAQYSLGDLVSALQQARDTFLLETGIVVSQHTVSVDQAVTTGRIDLDQTIMNVRRAQFVDATGISTVLRRDDTYAFTAFNPSWQTSGSRQPTAYSVSTTPPLVLQIAKPTTTVGTLNLLTLDSGEAIDVLDTAQVLGVPDDWAWVVIFGALAQLLQRDGLAVDASRAAFCDSIWQDGLQRATAGAVVLNATVNGTPRPLGSVSDADYFSAGWQMESGNPKRVLSMGQNLIGLWPPPGIPTGGGSYTVVLDVVQNAPVPVALSDYLQIGQEMVNDVLDYAQHLALFKEGPGAVEGSMGLFQQFMGLCGTEVRIKRASQPNLDAAVGQTPQDTRELAYQIPGA